MTADVIICAACRTPRIGGESCHKCDSSRFAIRRTCSGCRAFVERSPAWFAKRTGPVFCGGACESRKRESDREYEAYARGVAIAAAAVLGETGE